jgi:hypothetical protein
MNVVDKRYRLQLVKWLETGGYANGFNCHPGFKLGNYSPSDLTGLTIALSYSGRKGLIALRSRMWHIYQQGKREASGRLFRPIAKRFKKFICSP